MVAQDGANLARIVAAPTTCVVCGQPLGTSFWVVDHPRAAHEECIDWSARPLPFLWKLRGLQILERTLEDPARRVAGRALRVVTIAAERWPIDALVLLRGCKFEVERARAWLAANGVDRKLLQRF